MATPSVVGCIVPGSTVCLSIVSQPSVTYLWLLYRVFIKFVS